MCPDHADMRLFDDLIDLNRGFLSLITAPGARRAAQAHGLDSAIIDQLRSLSAQDLEFIARTPGLLAGFAKVSAVSLHRVAEMPAVGLVVNSTWRESARLYVTGLLTYLWQMEQHEQSYSALRAGVSASGSELLVGIDFARIHASADYAVDHLRARFADHPSFWPDLIRSACSGNEEFQLLSQLTIIPLVLAEDCSARQ